MITSQAKAAIEALKKSGFKRNEFSVRTEVEHHRALVTNHVVRPSYVIYGAAKITVYCKWQRVLECQNALVDNGMYITYFVNQGTGEIRFAVVETTRLFVGQHSVEYKGF